MTTPKMNTNLICPDCGAPMILRKTMKFPQRNGQPGLFYGCQRFPKCKATHGAHPDGRPLGIPGNAETKAARHRAHAAFDDIWEKRLLSRGAAYRWLSKKLGYEAHMGEMDVEQCERVIALCEAFDPSDPAAQDAGAEFSLEAEDAKRKRREKWKKRRANWSKKKKTEYNRAKRKRQKANRAARKAAAEST